MEGVRVTVDLFQSTLSVRRATYPDDAETAAYVISIHALREESDQSARHVQPQFHISIHALREESDPAALHHGRRVMISIHALREESDRSAGCRHCRCRYFNPRSP